MKLLEKIRNISYWFIDFIRGAKVKKHYKDICFILDNYNSSKAQIKRTTYLQNILQHAVNTTDFYKKFGNYNSLQDFPVINKNTILTDVNKFKSKPYLNKKLKHISTSGSTGVPLKITHDLNKKNRNTADNVYFSKNAGYKIGHQLLYLRHWRQTHKKSVLLTYMQNIIAIEVLDLNDEYISKLIKLIEKNPSTKGWLGYPSAFEVICRYLDKINSDPINANIKSIITMSEGLNDYTKRNMEKYFNVPVVSRYSNMENGIIAMQSISGENNFNINWASYFVEILSLKEDKPARSEEMGRIIITDLFNFSMPMIRYDTGDLGVIDYNLSPPAFTIIEGRKSDIILNTKGEIVSSFIIAEINSFEGVLQSQLIQEKKKEYTLKLNVNSKFNFELEIVNRFKSFLGNDAHIIVEYVTEIPLLSSGKRKTTLNNYLNIKSE